MKEREPDFEGDKIRMWRASREREGEEFEPDDTVLTIDGVTDEIYESRTYGLNLPPELLALRSLLAGQLPETTTGFEVVASLDDIASNIADSSLKVLAKRRKSDGLISFVVVAAGPGGGALIHRGDLVSEKRFHREVRRLERELLDPGLVRPPLVTSAEEWERYRDELDQ